MYGLGILYAFELNRPEDAAFHLERYLQILPSDINAMFVLARAYFMTEKFSQAIELYDRIITRTRDQDVRQGAINNREEIMRLIYE
jgi:cytochrome c-type biogenesis protein CcmH/NrfG